MSDLTKRSQAERLAIAETMEVDRESNRDDKDA